MSLLLVYLPDPAAAARLAGALAWGRTSDPAPRRVDAGTWPELARLAGRGADAAVFDPYAGAGAAAAVGRCASLRERAPDLALLPYADFSGPRARDLLRLARMGVRDVVLRGHDDTPAALRARLDGLLRASAADAVLRALGDAVPPPLRALVHRLVAEARAPLRPGDVARWEYCHPKTLGARLRAAGLPSLNRLIVWTRLLHAAHRISRSGLAAGAAAAALGFPSATAFHMQLRRYTGLRPSELAGGNGLARVAERFGQAVRESEPEVPEGDSLLCRA